MPIPPTQRLDLGAWLADLRRLGGQARTLAERPDAVEPFMKLSDLQMLEEAAKRLIVSLNKGLLYGLPRQHGTAEAPAIGRPAHAASPPTRDAMLPAADPLLHLSGTETAQTGPPHAPALPPAAPPGPSAAARQGIIGSTEPMRRVHSLIDKAAACSLPVLIQGESGTGKELVARAIHQRSLRGERRFFSENCSALSESLLESELFGHVRGAFTGADRDRKGILELAHGGILFLDEIGDMSLRMQSKLLRALQEREIRPVGGKEPIRIDVRLISATHRSLPTLIRDGGFREDLFYRVNVITIHLPPLRERRDDIPSLVEHFLVRIASDTGLPRKQCSS
ncbi:MAG TPA: sigma 54-interacting transcriptional regulator, partial [Candidatus Polarisedimenticolia bacterium]|nr:sigma 54-interacting transcriptional regulator [Candidatus Polarisedimenticolia bacterium]